MNRRITLYGILAAATTAVASGLVYSNAKSRLVAGLEAMEGNPQEISSLMAITQLSFLILIGASALTAVLFLRRYFLSSSSRRDLSS